jgi:hypothetical protein
VLDRTLDHPLAANIIDTASSGRGYWHERIDILATN